KTREKLKRKMEKEGKKKQNIIVELLFDNFHSGIQKLKYKYADQPLRKPKFVKDRNNVLRNVSEMIENMKNEYLNEDFQICSRQITVDSKDKNEKFLITKEKEEENKMKENGDNNIDDDDDDDDDDEKKLTRI